MALGINARPKFVIIRWVNFSLNALLRRISCRVLVMKGNIVHLRTFPVWFLAPIAVACVAVTTSFKYLNRFLNTLSDLSAESFKGLHNVAVFRAPTSQRSPNKNAPTIAIFTLEAITASDQNTVTSGEMSRISSVSSRPLCCIYSFSVSNTVYAWTSI